MTSLREQIKKRVPATARKTVRRLRQAITGPGLDEVELVDYRLLPDASDRPRLNLVVPTLSKKDAMGGANTYVELFLRLGNLVGADRPLDRRIIVTNSNPNDPTDMLGGFQDVSDAPIGDIEIHAGARTRTGFATRRNDVFMAVNWYSALNVYKLLEQQRDAYGTQMPLLYLLQDYTPNFFSFSSAQLLNLFALEYPWPTWRIYNSTQLYDYYIAHHGPATRDYVFSPKLPYKMLPFLEDPESTPKERIILVYGRPSQARNCFSILKKCLQIWSRTHPGAENWKVVSVGEQHGDIALANGRSAASAGKLTLDEYGGLLRKASVGVSLMASPHPSYPPLEMAHFGLLTLTNGFANKDLHAQAHENITSVRDPRPETMAQVLSELCSRVETDPTVGFRGESRMPGYRTDLPFECLEALAGDVSGLLD